MVDEPGIRWTPIMQYCGWCTNRRPPRMSLLEKHKFRDGEWLVRCTDTSLCHFAETRDKEPE